MRWVTGEALRNVVSGTSHALRYTLLLTSILGALILAETTTIDSVLVRAREYEAAGGSVTVLESTDRIDGATCDALARLPGIDSSGALRAEDPGIVLPTLPRAPLATYTVTDGLLKVVEAEQDKGTGVVVTDEIATTLNLRQGAELVTTTGATRMRGTFTWPQDGRRSGFGYAALVPTTIAETYDQCWVRAWPIPDELRSLIQLTLLPTDDPSSQVIVSTLNPTLASTFDGLAQFEHRVTQHAWAVACLAGAILGAVTVRTRRLEFAAGQHIGVSRLAQQTQIFVETVVWVAAAAVMLTAVTAVATTFASGGDTHVLVAAAAHIAVPGLLSTLLGAQLAAATIRERSLFRYFKNR